MGLTFGAWNAYTFDSNAHKNIDGSMIRISISFHFFGVSGARFGEHFCYDLRVFGRLVFFYDLLLDFGVGVGGEGDAHGTCFVQR